MMKRSVEFFAHDYDFDTAIEYVNTGMYSMLNCSFTSEDEDYGTDTIHSDSATPPKPREQMAYEMAQEIAAYLDATEDGVYRKNGAPYEKQYGDFSNSTLYAIEKALKDLAGDYKPDPKAWYATIKGAGKIIADRMLSGKCKQFALCDVDDDVIANYSASYFASMGEGSGEGWHGVKRIDGFFDNSPNELIVAVGYWGGGNCTFAYVDEENTDTSEPADAIAHAISESTGLDLDHVIFVEEDDKDE